MQAIQTRYKGPTVSQGSRVVARCEGGHITVPYDHGLDTLGNHEAAALALCKLLDWAAPSGCGRLPDGSYAHVFLP